MKRYGVDSVHSWILVLVGTLVITTTGGSFLGSSGLLYKTFIDYNHATEEDASWPSSVHAGMAILAGPVTAALSTRLSIRSVTTLGVLLYAVGHCVCFYSTNLVFICVFYGGLSGMGDFIATILVPALINRIFEKYRATAMGLIMSGIPLGALIYPLITRVFLEKYGLKGTFLLLGAVNMHGILGSVMLVELENKRDEGKHCSINDRITNKVSEAVIESPVSSVAGVYRALAQEVNLCASTIEVKSLVLYESISGTVGGVQRQDTVENTDSTIHRLIHLSRNRGFHLTNLAQCVSFLLSFLYLLLIVDYGTSKNLSYSKSFFLLSIYSVGMLFGRFALGCLSDTNLLPKTVYMFIAYGVVATLCLVMPTVFKYEYLVIITILYGTLLGNLIPIAYVLFADYLPKEYIILGMSVSRSCVGLVSLLRPLLIGTFSGESGSYDELFIFMGGLAAFTSLIMMVEFVWDKCQLKRGKS